MGKRKRRGLSSNVKIAYGDVFGSSTTVRSVPLNKTNACEQAQRKRLREQVAGVISSLSFFPRLMQYPVGLSFEERDILLERDGLDDDLLDAIPPGEEAMFMSHAGGVDEVHRDVLGQFLPDR